MSESTEFLEPSEHNRVKHMSESMGTSQQVGNLFQGNLIDASPLTSWLRESMMKFQASLRSQSHLPLILVIIFAVIFIMQVFAHDQVVRICSIFMFT